MHIFNGCSTLRMFLRIAFLNNNVKKKKKFNICELVTRSRCFGGKLRITEETQLCSAL